MMRQFRKKSKSKNNLIWKLKSWKNCWIFKMLIIAKLIKNRLQIFKISYWAINQINWFKMFKIRQIIIIKLLLIIYKKIKLLIIIKMKLSKVYLIIKLQLILLKPISRKFKILKNKILLKKRIILNWNFNHLSLSYKTHW